MREIKFRAWFKSEKCWVNPRQCWIKLIPDGLHFTTDKIDLSDVELSQFTGLHDKNGKEIYEGDIYIIETAGSSVSGIPVIEQVIWNNLGFKRADMNGIEVPYLCGGLNSKVEIIGNIYQNPELLKGVNNGH